MLSMASVTTCVPVFHKHFRGAGLQPANSQPQSGWQVANLPHIEHRDDRRRPDGDGQRDRLVIHGFRSSRDQSQARRAALAATPSHEPATIVGQALKLDERKVVGRTRLHYDAGFQLDASEAFAEKGVDVVSSDDHV